MSVHAFIKFRNHIQRLHMHFLMITISSFDIIVNIFRKMYASRTTGFGVHKNA